jgi:hypothetical protein
MNLQNTGATRHPMMPLSFTKKRLFRSSQHTARPITLSPNELQRIVADMVD